jgi:hypothetical protein
VNSVSPSLNARSILFVDKHGSGGQHLRPLFVVRPAADVTETTLQCCLDDSHRVLGGIEKALPGRFERWLRFNETGWSLNPRWWYRNGRLCGSGCKRMMAWGPA